MTMPPEITSGLIYAGPGSGSLLSAASAWRGLATELQQTAISYRNIVNGLTDAWHGSSAMEMSAALLPYIQWMESLATQASKVSVLAESAATAATTVKAMVVPPPLIAANRSQLLNLIASNLLGQNTAAIAATEAQYETMWAQDTTAMAQYSSSSSMATAQLTPFQPAPQVATPLAQAPAAVVPQTTFLEFLQQLFPGVIPGDPLGNLADVLMSPLGLAAVSSGVIDPLGLLGSFLGLISLGTAASAVGAADEAKNAANAAIAVPRAPSVSVNTPSPAPEVKAQAAAGNRIGPMRIPPSWAQPQQQGSVAEPFPQTTPGGGKKNVPIGVPVIPAVPVTGGKGGKKKGTQFEDMDYGEPVPPILNRHPSGG